MIVKGTGGEMDVYAAQLNVPMILLLTRAILPNKCGDDSRWARPPSRKDRHYGHQEVIRRTSTGNEER